MNKSMLGLFGVYLVILGLFFWQVRQESNKPENGYLNESYIVKLNSLDEEELYRLRKTQSDSSDSAYFMNLSEQQLIKKSALEVQNNLATRVNEKYAAVLKARIDFNNQLVSFADASYAFVEKSHSEYAIAEGEEAKISNENLTLLVENAKSTLRERNQEIWNTAWFAIGIYVLFAVIGSVILFNLETISHWLVNLFVQDATPGPIIAFLIGLSALGLIVRGLFVLYLAYSAIT